MRIRSTFWEIVVGFSPFIVRFLGIIISSVGTEQDFRPGGFPLEVGVIGSMPQSSGAAVLGWV